MWFPIISKVTLCCFLYRCAEFFNRIAEIGGRQEEQWSPGHEERERTGYRFVH